MDSGESLVLQALEVAVSQDPTRLQEATQKLQEWENNPQFYIILTRILVDSSQHHDVRLLAVTQIKNGIDLHWRKYAANRISAEGKVLIRKLLLESLAEPSDQITRQTGELISRIIRLEGPHDWPELLPNLVENIQHSSGLLQERSLYFLYRILKSKASKRLSEDIDTFRDLTSKMFVFLMELWKGCHSRFLELLQSSTLSRREEISVACMVSEHARICLKVLKTMVLYGVARFHAVFEPLTFVIETFDQIKLMSSIRLKVLDMPELAEAVEKTLATHMKMVTSLLSNHPISFADVINRSFEMLWYFLFTDEGISRLFERFALQLMTLLRMILDCEDYKPSPSRKMPTVEPPSQVIEVMQAKSTFFTSDRLVLMCQKLVTHYLILNEMEIVLWQEDPEEFLKEEAEANYQVSFKECVRVLLLVILSNYRLTVAPAMVDLIKAVQNTDNSADDRALLVKESVYKSAAYGAHDLYDVVDFDAWYSTHLVKELEIVAPRYQLVRTRVIQLVDNWIGIKMSPEFRPSLYQTYIQLLDPGEPLLLRLAVAETLRTTVDHLDFKKSMFAPYLSDSIARLQHVLSSVTSSWAKMKIIYTIAMVVERVEDGVCPYVESLVQQLPLLWREGSSENIVQDAIVDMLSRLVKSLGPLSVQLHSFIFPIIHLSTDVSQNHHIHLGDSGLDLWYTVMRNTTVMPPEMLHLFSNMAGILGLATPTDNSGTSLHGLMDLVTDNLSRCFEIIDSYVILGGVDFLQHSSAVVVEACRLYMDDVRPEGMRPILYVILRVLCMFPDGGPQLMKPCLEIIIKKIINKEEQKYSRVVSMYYMMFARIMFQNFAYFVQFLEEIAAAYGQNMVDLFAALVDSWEEHLDKMIELEHRKMTGLAMASLLPMKEPIVTNRFVNILTMCIEVLHDAVDIKEPEKILYDVVNHNLSVRDELINDSKFKRRTEEELRKHKIDQTDPLHMILIHEYIVSQLQKTLQSYGEKDYFSLMGSVDSFTLKQLSEFVPVALLTPGV